MKIEHLAIWTEDLEKSRDFYSTIFEAVSGEKYENRKKGFSSYFLSFEEGCRLEIMHMSNVNEDDRYLNEKFSGISHFAISVGTKEKVDELTERIREMKLPVVSEPRKTGDGYYESVILDPNGNRVEITI